MWRPERCASLPTIPSGRRWRPLQETRSSCWEARCGLGSRSATSRTAGCFSSTCRAARAAGGAPWIGAEAGRRAKLSGNATKEGLMAIQPDEQKMAMVARSGQAGFVITLIAATFLMGSSFVAGKILLQDGFSPMILVGWRFLVAALATLPLVFLDGAPLISALMPPRVGLREGALVILIGLIQTAAVMGLLFLAMRSISASTAAILLFSNPIWVAVLGRLFLGESLHSGRAVGLVVGV